MATYGSNDEGISTEGAFKEVWQSLFIKVYRLLCVEVVVAVLPMSSESRVSSAIVGRVLKPSNFGEHRILWYGAILHSAIYN